MRYFEIITEKLDTPYALDLNRIMMQSIEQASTVDELRHGLEHNLTEFLQTRLETMPNKVRNERLTVHVHPSTPSFPNGGAFRGDEDDDTGELPPRQDGVVDLFLFIDDERLEAWLDPAYRTTHNFVESVETEVQVLNHEFVHAAQFVRARKYGSLARYTLGRSRPTVDGRRLGKRGGYTSGHTGGKRQYLGQDIEIDAHAESAASEIILRAQREPPEERAAYIDRVLRRLRDSSPTLANYRQTFRDPDMAALFFSKGPRDPREQRQRMLVWRRFAKKLAQRLVAYQSQATA